jgi:hypothetical protein
MKSKTATSNCFLTLFFISFSTLNCVCQGYLLIIPNADCIITIDGELTEELKRGQPKKISLSEGEHFIYAKNLEGQELNKILEVEKEKQKILKLEFDGGLIIEKESDESFILISDLNLTLEGGINMALEEIDEEFGEYTSISELGYAFEKGDEILINGDITNKKGRFFIQLLKYPELKPIYTKQKLDELKNHKISITEKSIYLIQIGTTALFEKKINLKIKRRPFSKETRDFNTTVIKKSRLVTVPILEPSNHYINSRSNEDYRGGKSETIIPVIIPSGLIEWYYTVSASREEEDIKSNQKNFSLLGDLAKAINGINPATAAISIGLDLISQPPGADNCDVYLLDFDNAQLFNNDYEFRHFPVGTRTNIKSANVKLNCCQNETYFLGVKNTDFRHGIHIGVEAVGIKKEEYYEYVE